MVLSRFAAEQPIVLGLAPGGVPVAYELATALAAPLDVLIVREIRAPGSPVCEVGTLAEGGVRVLNHAAMRRVVDQRRAASRIVHAQHEQRG